jgi:hypothetical protein
MFLAAQLTYVCNCVQLMEEQIASDPFEYTIIGAL